MSDISILKEIFQSFIGAKNVQFNLGVRMIIIVMDTVRRNQHTTQFTTLLNI